MRVLSIILCFYIFNSSYSQSKTKKINFSSKQSKGITKKDKSLLILWNQVVFKHNKSVMHCDSATYDRGNNSFIAYSNIKIIENDSMKLYGDSLHYFGNEEKAYLYGNVKLITHQILLNANSLIYDQNNNNAYYNEGGFIKHHGKNYTINSEVGRFNSLNKILFFKKNVRLEHIDYQILSDTLVYHTETEKTNIIGDTKIKSKNSTISCSKGWFDNNNQTSSLKGNIVIDSKNYQFYADSVYYHEQKGEAFAKGKVKIIDDSSQTVIIGQYGYHNENKDSVRIWDHAIMTQFDSIDTIHVYADQFIHVHDSTTKKTFCFRNVVIKGTQIDGDCDSIYMNEHDSIMKCIQNPIIWIDSNQITGEEIVFKTFKGVVFSMDIENNGMIITKKDSNHYDQIKGQELNGYFKKNKLKKLQIRESGEVIYFSDDEVKKNIKEYNKVNCEMMNIYVDENRIRQISFLSNPKGVTVPLDQVKESLFLEGFMLHEKKTYDEKIQSLNGD